MEGPSVRRREDDPIARLEKCWLHVIRPHSLCAYSVEIVYEIDGREVVIKGFLITVDFVQQVATLQPILGKEVREKESVKIAFGQLREVHTAVEHPY